MGPELYGVKWHDFKLELVSQKYSVDAPAKLASPRILNLITDPHEREPVSLPHLHTWTATHFTRLIGAFRTSVEREPLIPSGAPLDHRSA